jgi:hypothetical protein
MVMAIWLVAGGGPVPVRAWLAIAARFVSNDDLKIDCHESGVYFWVMDC